MNTNVLVLDDPKQRLFGRAEPTVLLRELVKTKLLGESPQQSHNRLKIAHYTISAVLGQGGMGVVYAAYDERLERRVAIKLLRVVDEDGRERLAREARALARLSHPNVVHVHEVGAWDGHDYVVMELVDGITLRDWIDRHDARDWRDGLELMVQAGRGLAAAHAVELVHRDFKPANVMVAHDGRVRVLDFGLARWGVGFAAFAELEASQPMVVSTLDTGSLDQNTPTTDHTLSSEFVGTPDYMAPEQRRGRSASPQSDQYTFCVVLCEALGGPRPERNSSVIVGPPAGTPRWLRRAILRGLERDPALRWPSMDALLLELTRPRRTRRRLATATGLGLMIAVAVAIPLATADNEDRCAVTPQSWDAEGQQRLRQSWARSGVPHVATLKMVEAQLDAQQSAIVAARVEICEARTASEHEHALDLRSSCLDQRERELAAAVGALADGRPEVIERALDLLKSLGDVEICQSPELVEGWALPKDRETAREVGSLRTDLAEVEVLRIEGRVSEASERISTIESRALPLGYPLLDAEILHARGKLYRSLGADAEAWTALRDAAVLAERSGHLELAAAAWTNAVGSGTSADPERSTEYLMAVAALERVAPPTDLRWRELDMRLAFRLLVTNRPADALARAELATVNESTEDLGRVHQIRVLRLRGQILHGLGRRDEAIEVYRRGLSSCESLLGAGAFECGAILHDLGLVLFERPTTRDEAIEAIERSREIDARVHEPGSSQMVMSGLAVAEHARMTGDLETARRFAAQALAATPVGHADRSYSLDVTAAIALDGEDWAETEAALALSIQQHILDGRAHDPRVAYMYWLRSILRREQGRSDDELEDLRRALAIYADVPDGGGINEARIHVALGSALLELDLEAAIAAFERADEILDFAPDDEIRRNQTWGLARAMDRLAQPDRAIEYACAALASHQRFDLATPPPAELIELIRKIGKGSCAQAN